MNRFLIAVGLRIPLPKQSTDSISANISTSLAARIQAART